MKVLFACVHNAGRSQMAEAFFNEFADPTKAQALSAGTQPADDIDPVVMEVMSDAGITLSGRRPQLLTDDLAREVDLLVTMGCGEAFPHVPGLQREDWPLVDPKGLSFDQVCKIRDEIKMRVLRLLQSPTSNNYPATSSALILSTADDQVV